MIDSKLIRLQIGGQSGVCKGCGRSILWFLTVNARPMPMERYAMPRHVNEDGTAMYAADDSHWASCPAIARFKKKG